MSTSSTWDKMELAQSMDNASAVLSRALLHQMSVSANAIGGLAALLEQISAALLTTLPRLNLLSYFPFEPRRQNVTTILGELLDAYSRVIDTFGSTLYTLCINNRTFQRGGDSDT